LRHGRVRLGTLAYTSAGTLASITDPASRVTNVIVDSNDNLTQITDHDSHTATASAPHRT